MSCCVFFFWSFCASFSSVPFFFYDYFTVLLQVLQPVMSKQGTESLSEPAGQKIDHCLR